MRVRPAAWRRAAPRHDFSYRAASSSRRRLTAGHSAAVTLNLAELRGFRSVPSRWARKMPSKRAPIRCIASRERWFLASVCRHTDWPFQVSKAWVSMRRFISVFAPVLIASGLSQV
jgi:hypothetical protein